eukprot:6204059-Pleurochrysis_carterae.AAC.2
MGYAGQPRQTCTATSSILCARRPAQGSRPPPGFVGAPCAPLRRTSRPFDSRLAMRRRGSSSHARSSREWLPHVRAAAG